MTNHVYPARPDPSQVSGTLLSNPTEGQFWYNTSNKHMYAWNGFEWIPIMNRDDYAANWGQVSNGQRIPRPISADGYIFEYDECIWSTSPAVLGKFDNFICYADGQGVVTAQYRPTGGSTYVDGIANYLIIGIRGNHNRGVIVAPPLPSPTPTVTPTLGASATPTPTVSTSAPLISPSPTSTVTPTIGVSSTPSPTPTKTPAATPSVTPSVTPSLSALPPLVVSISDPEGLTDASSLTSYCDLGNYDSYNRDNGYSGCSATTISTCPTGACSPEPGDNGLGPVMRIMVTGGQAPYTVKLKNFNYSDYYSIPNYDFELGDTGWSKQTGWSITNTGLSYTGTWSAKFNGGSPASITSQAKPVVGGRSVTASARVYLTTSSSPSSARIVLNWYDASMNLISYATGTLINSSAGIWQVSTVTATAPSNAKFVSVAISANKSLGQGTIYADTFTWNIGNNGTPECFFVGGASVPVIPFVGTVKTYSIAQSGQTTPIISLNGICGTSQFNMSGNFDIEVTDSAGNVSITTKRWEIYRTASSANVGGGGGGCVISSANIYKLGTASSANVGDAITTYNVKQKTFGTNTITFARPKLMECVRVTTATGISLSCSVSAPLSLEDGTQIYAPAAINKNILVFSDGNISTDVVVNVENLGIQEVNHISCEDNYFLASDGNDNRYILHHNKMATDPIVV